MQVSTNRLRNLYRESICVFTHAGPKAAYREGRYRCRTRLHLCERMSRLTP